PGLVAAAAEVVSDAEALPGAAEHDQAGRGILVGLGEPLLERAPHIHAQRVELLRPVQGDEADLLAGLVAHQVLHRCVPPPRYDATHCMNRSSIAAMRSASHSSSSRIETARLSGWVGSCVASSGGMNANASGWIGP